MGESVDFSEGSKKPCSHRSSSAPSDKRTAKRKPFLRILGKGALSDGCVELDFRERHDGPTDPSTARFSSGPAAGSPPRQKPTASKAISGLHAWLVRRFVSKTTGCARQASY